MRKAVKILTEIFDKCLTKKQLKRFVYHLHNKTPLCCNDFVQFNYETPYAYGNVYVIPKLRLAAICPATAACILATQRPELIKQWSAEDDSHSRNWDKLYNKFIFSMCILCHRRNFDRLLKEAKTSGIRAAMRAACKKRRLEV